MSPIRALSEPGGPARVRSAAMLWVAGCLAACGHDAGAPPGAAQVGETERGQRHSPGHTGETGIDGDSGVLGELPVLFPEREQRQPKGVRYHMRRADPTKAGWTTEVFADAAEPVLVRFFQDLLADADALSGELDGSWAGSTPLVPAELAVDFDDGNLSVLRGVAYEATRSGRETLPQLAAALLERYSSHVAGGRRPADDGGAQTGPIEVSVDLVGIRASGAHYETRARVQLARRGAAPMQHNLEFGVDWLAEDLEQPRPVGLRLEAFEEVRASAPLFAEVTEHAFGDTPRYAGDLLRGVDEFLGRTDRVAGFSFQGMQGVAVADVNADGIDDIYVCQQVGLPNQLLLGGPDGKFTDGAREANVDFIDLARTALIFDWDNDGDQDLVVATGVGICLCLNDGQGVFARPTWFSAQGGAHFYSLSAADADGDGDIDLYGGRYSAAGIMRGAPAPYHDANNGASNYYLRNDGPGEMVDATEEAGFGVGNVKFTLASIWEDFDADGDLDLYVVNDFGRNNLFANDGTGHFVDVAEKAGAVDIGAGMGATAADYDLDGDVDLYVTNMWSAPGQRIVEQSTQFLDGQHLDLHRWYDKHASGNTLLANRGDGTFEDVTQGIGGALGRWAWGGKFIDFDNDAYEDLYVPCGQTTREGATYDLESFFWRGVISLSPLDGKPSETYNDAFSAIHHMLLHQDFHWNGLEPNVAYQNLSGGRFADVSVVSAADFLGDGRAMAVLDWDRDGRLDMLVKSRTAPRLRLMHNRSRSGHAHAAFDLVGVHCNRDAVGARVTLEAGGRSLSRRLYAGDGYLSQSSKCLTFGLGDARRIERAIVDWPDGSRDVYADLAVGARYRIVQGSEAPMRVPSGEPWSRAAQEIPARTPQPNRQPVTRVPLFEGLPMRPFPLPSIDQPGRRVQDFEGAPLVVQLWTAAHPSGAVALAELQRAKLAAEGTGTHFVTLSVDEGPHLARARKAVAEAGLEPGYADGRALAAYEVVAFEVLDVFHDLPLPFTLAFDPAGVLVVVYCGLPIAEDLALDLRAIARGDSASIVELRGGRRLVPRQRRLDLMATIFETQGSVELAQFYRSLVAAEEAEKR